MRHTNTDRSKHILTKFRIIAIAAVMISLTTAFLVTENVTKTQAASGIAKSFIIQLNADSAAVWKAKQEKTGVTVSNEQLQDYRNSLLAEQDAFLANLSLNGIDFEIDGVDIEDFNGSVAHRADFRFSLVLNGITLKLPAAAVETVRAMEQVKKVETNGTMRVHLGNSVPYVRAPEVYGEYPELTQYDNFREGYEGQGINIAVLDTGIDWTHPMFGGDPTPPRLGVAPSVAAVNTNQKVIYYLPLSAGFADDFGHGSHAASDAAGYQANSPGADGIPLTADDKNIHGVAPQARLMGYKVCTGTGNCVNASTILGIEDAVSPVTLTLQAKPIAHVINMSLGGTGTPDSASAIAADAAALLGTTVVASAGNSGPGESTIGAPSTGRHVISVGATTHPGAANANWSADLLAANAVPTAQVGAVIPASHLAAAAGFSRLKIYPMAGTPNPASGSIAQRYSLVNMVALDAMYPSTVSGRIALVKTSAIYSATFAQICNNAALNGAAGMILISTTTNPTALASTIPCGIVSPEDGEVLIDAMSLTDDNNIDPPNGTVSELPVRMNPFLTDVFVGETAGFSSRGPVDGLGQIKPDLTAPGVGIIGATVRVGGATSGGGTMFNATGFIAANGTSFSGPHVAGAAALVKQSHLSWTPDMIRTALMNTSTNLRRIDGSGKSDGNTADSIIEQGSGLIDVAAAVNTRSLMGVEADGVILPGILGSHSFGELPILNNRIVNERTVAVTIRNLSNSSGTYNLSTAANRETHRTGIVTSVSQSSITVPAGGKATFTAKISLDGSQIRDESPIQLQWYVNAVRQGSSERMRMPLYLKAAPSLPTDEVANTETSVYTGTVLAGDGGVQRDNEIYVLESATYVDVPFEADESTVKIDAALNWDFIAASPEAGAGVPDLDFLLFDPNGNEIGNSGNGDTNEHISADATIPGTYIYRVYGWANGPTDFEIESNLLKVSGAPSVNPIIGEYDDNGTSIDFNGKYKLTWEANGVVEKYEIEESTDGGVNWSAIKQVAGTATSHSFKRMPEGTRSYRIRSIAPGQIGKFVSPPSNEVSVTISRRRKVNATSSVDLMNQSIVFAGGKTTLQTALMNHSETEYFPVTSLEIVSVESFNNSVTVSNADSGGNGVSSKAVFDYSGTYGSSFTGGETSSAKTIIFNNPNTVLFTFKAKVKAYILCGPITPGANESEEFAGATDGGVPEDNGSEVTGVDSLVSFMVNPLTGTMVLIP